MLIKVNGLELEISNDLDVYLGSKKNGQTFKKWTDLNDIMQNELKNIRTAAEKIVKHAEHVLLA